jgi:phytoene synthase
MAARLFPSRTRDAAFSLYGWCRYCDDQIDCASTVEEKKLNLEKLIYLTKSVYRGEPQSEIVFIAFQEIVQRYGIPEVYALELLNGMAMDVSSEKYETLGNLELYCYRVAGVVGLMMCHIMGIYDEAALSHAVSLGIAMQMSNISRDVFDDANLGRIYLPREWLREQGLEGDLSDRSRIALVVRRLLRKAREHYEIGERGIRYLPFRAALAVIAASKIYSSIGTEVEARGKSAWDRRVTIPGYRKCLLLAQAVLLSLGTLPQRLLKKRSVVSIRAAWRYGDAHEF